MMNSLVSSELDFIEGEEDMCEIQWSTPSLSVGVNQFAEAYHQIRVRLAGLERENSSIRRKLRNYQIKFPMISAMEDDMCCSREVDELELIQKENSSLQQRINSLIQELQESKAHEQSLEEVIKAYEKIHLEKSSVQKELDTMTTLAEQHVERIRMLETALGQREMPQNKRTRETSLHCNKDTHYLHLYTSLDTPCELDCSGLQSSRSLDTLTDLKVQRLEAELEGAWHEARGACQREEELKTELQRLQEEIRQEKQRQEMETACEHCSLEWLKEAGDEQVNLALAYTELMEELKRIRTLIRHQNQILQQNQVAEQSSCILRHGSASPPSVPTCPSSHLMRSQFQGRRSYSDMADPSSPQMVHTLVSTLPKRRTSSQAHLRLVSACPRPSSANGALQLSYRLPDSTPGPLTTPPQSSDDEEEEEWAELRIMTPPPQPISDNGQSWPSIKLWMELEESECRSCPLCQLSFPTGFPDDALITHIDTHLENSKI